MHFVICALNKWLSEAGDLRRHRAHYDVIVMSYRNGDMWPLLEREVKRALQHTIVP